MKILYLITRAELGGAQVHLADLIHGLRDRADIAVAAGEDGYLASVCKSAGVRFHHLPSLVQPLQPLQDLSAFFEIRRLLRSERPDLVHLHTSKAGLLGRLAAAFDNVPWVFTAHTWSFAEGIGAFQKCVALPCEWIAGRLSGRIISVSESNRRRALQFHIAPPARITTIWNGVPDTPHRAEESFRRAPRLTMVARFVRQKDHQTLLEAAAGIQIPFKLRLVGDGPLLQDMEQLASRLGLSERVSFLGARRDIDRILADSDIFVLATKWEGFPLTIIEAMRAGLPVVASDVDGVREAVSEGETGHLVPKGNVEALRSRLEGLIQAPGIRRAMGAAGRRRYESDFTVETMSRKVWGVYQEATRVTSVRDQRPAAEVSR